MIASTGMIRWLAFPMASNVAFGVVFGVFVAALVVLAVVTMTWAVRKDRPGREAWRQRMLERHESPHDRSAPPRPDREGIDRSRRNGSGERGSST
jgi:hypothetical protein